MKAYGEVDVYIHIFVTSTLLGGGWSASRPGHFTPRYPFDRSLCEPQNRPGRRGEEKILDPTVTQLLPLGRPARIQSLYRLRYPGQRSCPYSLEFYILM
jgi:hypothetical protein